MKPLEEQVIVITGASSGIGLTTAELAAGRGARVVLVSRSIRTLHEVADRLNGRGGSALAVECDVTDRQQVERAAAEAAGHFGRIDTWVNNAALGLYGRLDVAHEADARRVFDVNFWGVYNGSLTALPYLRQTQGTLINMGSEVSEAAMPLLGIYTASKHAVKGFTDTLRLEVERLDQSGVHVTLIQPSAVNTPFPQHAVNYMEAEPRLPEPTLAPEKVAEAILEAAVHPTRDRKVGSMSVMNTLIAKLAPSLGDRMAAARADEQKRAEPPRHPAGVLYEPSESIGSTGRRTGWQPARPPGMGNTEIEHDA